MCLGNNISRAKVRDLAYTPVIASQLPPSVLKDEPSASFIGSGRLSLQRSAAMFVDGIERRGRSGLGEVIEMERINRWRWGSRQYFVHVMVPVKSTLYSIALREQRNAPS